MDTPRNITELKLQVRRHLAVSPPGRREIIKDLANVQGTPDLFGWIRLWVVMQQDKGWDVDSVVAAIVDGADEDGC